MTNFFKVFFAALLAFLVFTLIIAVVAAVAVSSVVSSDNADATGNKAVLVVDLSQPLMEIEETNPLSGIVNSGQNDVPSLYELVTLIRHAKTDSAVKGIYIKCQGNSIGFGAADELRNAIADFKSAGKFVYSYADVINQRAYYVANVADRVYCNPKGGMEWQGFVMQMPFIKGALEKLEIEPQIFYAGKFKSATEPLREKKMTDANRLQSGELLYDLYGRFLVTAAQARKKDTATLHRYANENLIQFPSDALKYGLVDGLKYDDEVKEEIRERLKLDKDDKINFITPGKYALSADYQRKGKEKIAVLYAEGDIIDGKGERGQIGSETYRAYIRKLRLDKTIKAIVIRINSGGGSALASENIWREIQLARKDKPVVVSFGDVAASGGYYLSCNADSIFAQPNSITGSIGVFSLLPDMQKFFNNKLGVTFDAVKTSPDADAFSVTKPLTPLQKQYFQAQVDSIYHDFKFRVAEGRKKSMDYVDSIAQGRVWSGARALELGLVDRIGGLDDAIASAATLAKVTDYRLKEYPGPQNFLDRFFDSNQQSAKETAIKSELGETGYQTYNTIRKIKQLIGTAQARLPFDLQIE